MEVPAVIPVTSPLAEPIAAFVLLTLQEPPATGWVTVPLNPTQRDEIPPMPAGNGLTVTTAVVKQPAPSEYVIVAMPAATPVTIPVPEPTPAIPGTPESQVPPGVASVSKVVEPKHTLRLPLIAPGEDVTVTDFVA